jgi:hypothetical protein
MARKNRTRAMRRVAQRTVRNALALEEAVEAEETRPKLASARHKTQLEFLAGRTTISDRQHQAGERLALDFRIAGDMPKVVAPYEPRMASPSKRAFVFNGHDGPIQIDARHRFEKAMQAVGLRLSPLLMHVAVLDQPLADWHRPGVRNGDGAALLRLGLDVLADHYRLPEGDGRVGEDGPVSLPEHLVASLSSL